MQSLPFSRILPLIVKSVKVDCLLVVVSLKRTEPGLQTGSRDVRQDETCNSVI